MGALATVGLALALAGTASGNGPVARWRPLVEQASLRFGVPSVWIERVIEAESDGQTRQNGAPIRSRAGAMGLMQLMPSTWHDMRAELRLGTDPDDPHDNIYAGTLYLRQMYDRFGYPGVFAAYNAGPARFAAHLAGGGALPNETVTYLAKLSSRPAPAVVPASIFAIQQAAPARTERPASLFVPLSDAPASRP